MGLLRSINAVRWIDIVRNSVIRKRCELKEDVVTRTEKGTLRWFGHTERMDEWRLTT